MFMFKVRKLFRKTFGPWVTAAPPRPKPQPTFRPRLEWLEDRLAPANVAFYWDPTFGANASTTANWDLNSLGSGTHPAAAPGNTAGETDFIYFDGTAGKGGNKSCTWDYTPTNTLGVVSFQNGWTQTVAFNDKKGISVSNGAIVSGASAPTLAPNGNSGANAVPAITLKNGSYCHVSSGCSLDLTGYSSGNAVFFGDDLQSGEYLWNEGTVTYTGQSSQTGNTDYLGEPVLNEGTFIVNGGGSTGTGSTLQVATADSKTNNVSFYQDSSNGQTNISGGGTLWCYNNYTMTAGMLQTTDGNTDILKVGTSGSTPVDGTATLTFGTVKIYPSGYGKLQIVGTTGADVPILNVGSVMLNFSIDLSNSNNRSQLIVGDTGGTGRVNFGYNGGTAAIALNPQGSGTVTSWDVLYYGSVTNTGSVHISTAGYSPNWGNPKYLEVDKM
jgi:hypothetical protein